MLNLEPFRTPVPWRRGIDRLEITSVDPVVTGSKAPLRPEEALARLTQAGLACGSAKGSRLHLLGGTSRVVDRDISGYLNAFAILGEPDGRFTMLVSGGGGHPDQEATLETLSEAVDAVLSVYRARSAR